MRTEVIAIASKEVAPSRTALKTAVRSAQFVRPKEAFPPDLRGERTPLG